MDVDQNDEQKVSYKNIIKIAYPVILTMFSMNIMIFVDRAFVAKYNITQFAATLPASNLALTVGSVFTGVIAYCAMLISQYYGAKKYKECSSVMWQSIYLSVIFSALLLVIAPLAVNIFKIMGHSGDLLKYEMQYFYIVILSTCVQFFSTAFSCLFRGIGDTKVPMVVGIIANVANIILDWVLIFGKFGFPKLGGIVGGGSATVISCIIGLLLYILFLNKDIFKNQYKIFVHKKLDKKVINKLLHFGFPSGIQNFVAFGYYSILLLMIGKTGEFNLSCASIAFTIEGISIFPVTGLATAISIIVGQERGAGRTENIIDAVKKGVLLGMGFNLLVIIVFNFFPYLLISVFNSGGEQASVILIRDYTVVLVRLTSVWIVFDTIQIIIGNVLRALGETVFMMRIFIVMPILFYMVIPYILCFVLGLSFTWIWIGLVIYSVCMFSLVTTRLLSGKWKKIEVI